MKEDNIKHGYLPLIRIFATHHGQDRIILVGTVRKLKGTFKWPVVKTYQFGKVQSRFLKMGWGQCWVKLIKLHNHECYDLSDITKMESPVI